jgi:hypothetical protein
MSNESLVGRDAKVTLGANIILGLGTWSITGGNFAELDDTAFGDESMQTLRGLRTGGEVAFSGNGTKKMIRRAEYDQEAYWNKSDLTDIRFYVDDTSYYTPNSTTGAGGGLPASTMSAISRFSPSRQSQLAMGDLAKTEFTGKIIGAMRLDLMFNLGGPELSGEGRSTFHPPLTKTEHETFKQKEHEK